MTSSPPRSHHSPWPFLRPLALPAVLAGVIQVVAAIAAMAPYWALVRLGETLPAHDIPGAWRAVVVLAIGVGLTALLSSAALLVMHLADVWFQARLRRRAADTLGRAPLAWFDERPSSEVRTRIQNDVDSLHHLVGHAVVETIAGALTPLVGVAFCFVLDWRLGLATLVPLIAYVVVYAALTRGNPPDLMARIAAQLERVSAATVEYVNGIGVLKVFGRAGEGSRRFTREAEEFADEFGRLVGPPMRAQAWALATLALPSVAVVVLGTGLATTAAGWTNPGEVLVVTLVALMLPHAVVTLVAGNQARGEALAAAERLQDLLATPPLPQPTTPATPASADVELDHVTFGYDADSPVVTDVSLRLPAGTTTALVGPSGAGKSTVGSLVARFRDPDSGVVRLGGVDLRDVDEAALRRWVGVVLQETHLLALSVHDNIALGHPTATRAEVEQAARRACIHETIAALPHGYDSLVGTEARLSGGEAQRICIARAMLNDTPVVVLDEATSATDPESETEIRAALAALTRGRTVITIAHRLTNVVDADQIAVLDRGRVVECGRHDELLAAGGRYAALWHDLVGPRDAADRPDPEAAR